MPNGRVMLRLILKHFQLERGRIGILGERNLLGLTLAGQSVADIEAFREKYNYILRAIPCQLHGGDERPPFTVGNKRARKRLARDAVGPMFECACSPNSSMGTVFKDLNIPHLRLAKECVDSEPAVVDEQLAYQLSQCVRPNLWAAIPCVSGSPWQRLNLHRVGKPLKKELGEKSSNPS